MSAILSRIVEAAQRWERRDDLSDWDRHFAAQVGELAATLARNSPFPHADDMDSLRLLSCRLCQRVGAANCREPESSCCLGFNQAA